jgi:flagellar biosynthetic protein FlhB
MSQDDDDKHFEPSDKKLADARKRGEIAKSTDLNTAAAYGGLLLAAGIAGPASVSGLAMLGTNLVGRADTLAPVFFAHANPALTGGVFQQTAISTAPLFFIPAIAVLLALLAQQGITFAPEKLQPKLSRIDPITNAKNKFGANGLFEFTKSMVKLIIISILLTVFLIGRLSDIVASIAFDPGQVSVQLIQLSLDFLLIVVIVSTAIGAVDYAWHYFEHRRKNRMSQQDIKDEAKDSEGDPLMKQKRRQRAMEIASRQLLTDVPGANVIVVNPTHYAVALKWDRSQPGAPVCVAKGVDEIAARIREIANEHGIPIHSDPPTARALHATVEIGAEISSDHYKPVAAAIRFADDMRRKARNRFSQ